MSSAFSPDNASTDGSLTVPQLDAEIRAWTSNRDTANAKLNWQFSTDDARVKLKHLYPQTR